MFLKLFKYDFKACSRYELPILLVILGATIIGCLDTVIICLSSGNGPVSVSSGVGIAVGVMGITSVIVVCSVAATVMTFMLYLRFYKSMATDEAYLTFTIPVSPSQILLAKLTSAILWSLISAAAIILSISAILLCALTFSGNIIKIPELLPNIDYFLETFSFPASTLTIFVSMYFVSIIESFLQVYMAILFGSSIARKHKALASIGMVLAINFAVNSVISTLTAYSNVGLINSLASGFKDSVATTNIYLIIQLIIYITLSIVFFLLSKYFITKKVNLE